MCVIKFSSLIFLVLTDHDAFMFCFLLGHPCSIEAPGFSLAILYFVVVLLDGITFTQCFFLCSSIFLECQDLYFNAI